MYQKSEQGCCRGAPERRQAFPIVFFHENRPSSFQSHGLRALAQIKQLRYISTMTIYQLKALNKANGGKYFDHDSMKYSGETLRNLRVRKFRDAILEVSRKDGKRLPTYFSAT